MRLQKYLAQCGVSSRRAAEVMIAQGRVKVNGEVVTQMGVQVELNDEVTVDGNPVRPEEEKHYLLYHKPMGEVATASDPEGRPTVLDKFRDYPVRLYPVGRLDYDSEGLLLLTNDGELTQRMLHPSREVEKVYLAQVSNRLAPEAAQALRAGVMVNGRRTAPAKVVVLKYDAFSTSVLVTIHEGRNRQVRRMFEAVGHQVVLLRRVQFGPLKLGDVPRGQWRHLTEEEVQLLKRL
jgi:23S rRNA pseudouridine2605 synthase